MIKYRVTFTDIKKVNVIKETDKTVWLEREGRRGEKYIRQERKTTSWQNIFNSFQEAKTFLLERAERDIKRAEERVIEEQKVYEKIKQLKEEDSENE